MKIGIPKELKNGERRVAVTPAGVSRMVKQGNELYIEKSAGELSGFLDAEYLDAGANILDSNSDVWNKADLIVKVKEPDPREYALLRPDITVFSFLHPAASKELTQAILRSGATGLDYDLVMLEDGRLPILEPMSIIAGKLSIQSGARALEANSGGRGILLGGTETVEAGKVVIIGGGNAGKSAAEVALGMGAKVSILDINLDGLASFKKDNPLVKLVQSSPETIDQEIAEADLVIGAVLIPGAKAPKLISQKSLSLMKQGSVLVDICIDQGGFAESSRPTSIEDPIYIEQGVVHSCVANMPALVPRTSTLALTEASIGWIEKIAEEGAEAAVKKYPALMKSLTMYQGNVTNQEIAETFNLKYLNLAGCELLAKKKN